MPANMNSVDMFTLYIILGIAALLVLIVDFIIFCYWISYKYKQYSYEQMYGPIIQFPPRETGYSTATSPQQSFDIEHDAGYQSAARAFATGSNDSTQRVEHQPPTAFAPPQFDFLPNTEIDEEQTPNEGAGPSPSTAGIEPEPDATAAIESAESPPTFEKLNSDTEMPLLLDTEVEQPSIVSADQYAAHSDPLEDARPIDPRLMGASGGIRSPFASTWSLVHPFVAGQFVLAVVNVLALVLIIPAMFSAGPNVMETPYGLGVIILSLFVQNIGFVGVTAYLLKGYGTSLSRIGLKAPTGREVMLGLVYGACLTFAAVMLEKGLNVGASHVVSKELMKRLTDVGESVSAGGQFEKIHGVGFQIWFMIAGAIAAPIGEEVFFRGLLYNGLKKRWGIPAGVIISAVCFALIHLAPLNIIIIIPMGCVLAMAYERTKSLWVTILMHAVNNGAQLAAAMYTIYHVAAHK